MAKRLRESALSAQEATRKKKQKLNDDGTAAKGSIDSVKEAKRERKRRRKLEKEANTQNHNDLSNVHATTSISEEPIKSGIQSVVNDGISPADPIEKAQEKAARKEARKQEKLVKKSSKKHGEKVEDSQKVHEPESERVTQALSMSQQKYSEDPILSATPQAEVDAFLKTQAISIKDPNSKTPLRPITKFCYLPPLAASSPSPFATFECPTPVQAATWPFLLSRRDVVGVAETGSGKTFAFGLPLVQHLKSIESSHLSKRRSVRAVVVSPTRELASQIYDQITLLATPNSLSCSCLYGGVPKDDQRAALKRAQIIIATPGRLNDLIEEGAADLSQVQYLVLDEADRMLDKGFEDAIRQIISNTPSAAEGRQTAMFTATWPPSVRDLASTFLKDPVHIRIGHDNPLGELRANNRIEQRVEVIDPRDKEKRLLQIIKQHSAKKPKGKTPLRILVFALYKKEASRLHLLIQRNSLSAVSIHGDMAQSARTASLASFKTGEAPLLVATDVAARGLDIPDVSLVINATFPLTTEDYVHRIGRTGRAGKEGLAITLFTEHDKGNSGALINVLKAAGQEVPQELLKFGGTVKKKGHEVYGNFYRDTGIDGEKAVGTKIKFDD